MKRHKYQPAFINIRGYRFGKLTVVRDSGFRTKYGKAVMWLCRCACGNGRIVWGNLLRKRKVRSCIACTFQLFRTRGGLSTSPTYHTWAGMLARCYNEKSGSYEYYGARGIAVCTRWRDSVNGFANFLLDMGPRPEGKTLDRIEVNGNYTKSNCRWATPLEQASNRRNSKLTADEETATGAGFGS